MEKNGFLMKSCISAAICSVLSTVLPPYESLPPFPFPENTPSFCFYPPFTPRHLPRYQAQKAPTYGTPQSAPTPNPPIIIPSPPSEVPNPATNVPTPTQPLLSPPYYDPSLPNYAPNPPSYRSSPPSYEPNPPFTTPSPYGFIPSPHAYLPPIVFPPPTVPPPPHISPTTDTWCVAKASEAMNYACGSGADCDQIQSTGSCFEPNTLFAHASYAFNSYWQRTKVACDTCDFGGTAILVTVDPSYDGCHFLYL